MAHSSKAAVFEVVRHNEYHFIPMVHGCNLNIDFNSSDNYEFISFIVLRRKLLVLNLITKDGLNIKFFDLELERELFSNF